MTAPIIGIDLGTTYTSVSVVTGKKVVTLARDDGPRLIPSVIAFPSRDEVIIGEPARARLATDPARTVASPKRVLGRPFDDREVQTYLAQAPWKSTRGPDGTAIIEIWRQPYAVPQLCAFLLREAREIAELRLEQPISQAVISIPVTFDDARIAATTRAAQLAGLEVAATIAEPTAAALANRYVPGFGGIIGIYDFGGGTFDFSLVDVSRATFEVLATAGDTWLGGDDLDQVLADAAANQFWRQHKVDLRKQAVEWQRLRFACEAAKRLLSTEESALIAVPEVMRTATGMVDLELQIDRATLARAAGALIQRSLAVCDSALARAGLRAEQLSAVYLCGGTTHVPAIRDAVGQHFGVPLRVGVAPDQAVSLGAAIHGSLLAAGRAVV
ncbi:MAG: Hsp70 family protein [Kofleriaceae bacterium]